MRKDVTEPMLHSLRKPGLEPFYLILNYSPRRSKKRAELTEIGNASPLLT